MGRRIRYNLHKVNWMSAGSDAIIALRGWHPAIARAEAQAMFPDSKIVRTEARRLVIAEGESDWSKADILSGTECVLIGGGIQKWTSLEDLIEVIDYQKREDLAVECWRHEGKLPIGTSDIERQVGGLFHKKGSTFNL